MLDADIWARLRKLADSAGSSVAELASDVLRDYAEESEQRIAAIEAGIAQADAGDLVPWEEVDAGIEARLAAMNAGR